MLLIKIYPLTLNKNVSLRAVGQPGILFGRGQSPDVRPTVPSVYFPSVYILFSEQFKLIYSTSEKS